MLKYIVAASVCGYDITGMCMGLLTRTPTCMQSLLSATTMSTGHMEKQETEMKRKLEMETGNGNLVQPP